MHQGPLGRFRLANLEDAPAIVQLVNTVYRGPGTEENWTTESAFIEGPRTNLGSVQTLIAASDSAIVILERDTIDACALIKKQAEGAYFGLFSVRSALQKQGFGRAMLKECESRAVQMWNAKTMEMTVINLRLELIDYYLRRGYAPTGEREAFPFDETPGALRRDFDLVVLRKTLR
ncbi:MAG TPA: GNAT family N-acetyltransferase [Alphaproteobacteria bacterium]|nr:GNAT family N-acetyltransferase [Alphaproteobacteria bacterium]HAJ47586.1 GNAT family N-acetyltransferase [Alphaproteobacteria bacterium]